MASPRLLIVSEDAITFDILRPVAERLDQDFEVSVLFFDHVFREMAMEIEIDESDIDFPCYSADRYVRNMQLEGFAQDPKLWYFRRAVVDNAHSLVYDMDALFDELDPDAILSTIDQIPFFRNVIEQADRRSVPVGILQYGLFKYQFNGTILDERPASPTMSPRSRTAERLKRRLLFKYGVNQFCHPNTSFVMSLGDYFTERITGLREEYPTSGAGRVVKTGTPEFDREVRPYDPDCDSALFLSQQHLEGGFWRWDKQKELVERLSWLDDQIPVTVRPHPKDADVKVEHFEDHLDVSKGNSLEEDVANHDVIVTLSSTALLEGIVRGKVGAVLELDGYRNEFPPLTRDHILDIGYEPIDFEAAVRERSPATQREWLERFSYMPGEDDECDANSSAELVAETVRRHLD